MIDTFLLSHFIILFISEESNLIYLRGVVGGLAHDGPTYLRAGLSRTILIVGQKILAELNPLRTDPRIHFFFKKSQFLTI